MMTTDKVINLIIIAMPKIVQICSTLWIIQNNHFFMMMSWTAKFVEKTKIHQKYFGEIKKFTFLDIGSFSEVATKFFAH